MLAKADMEFARTYMRMRDELQRVILTTSPELLGRMGNLHRFMLANFTAELSQLARERG